MLHTGFICSIAIAVNLIICALVPGLGAAVGGTVGDVAKATGGAHANTHMAIGHICISPGHTATATAN